MIEVFGQKKLLKWSIPGAAHFFVFWAFLILGTVYLEAYGILLSRNEHWAIPVVGHWDALGFAQDLIALLCLLGIGTFSLIRLKESPGRLGRKSRFSGSHTGGAWLVLFMIFNVIWTLFLFRGAAAAGHHLPYGNGAFVSTALGKILPDSATLEGVGLLLHIGVMLVFLVDVVHSKHLHIFVAPLNVLFSRRPQALGAAKPLMNAGKPVTLDDIDDLDEDAKLGVGAIEDFSWKGILDFATCTECGRCQSQCPAWNTEKPLSPKMLIMMLRDHAMAKGPAILAGPDADRASLPESAVKELDRPLVGETEGYAWEPTGGGVIDPDVLWSCVTCGACVNQCPVDIEHVDHIIDMRRYQVLVESNFPSELNGLFKGMENKGNPWNLSATARLDWAKDLPFEVKVVGADPEQGGIESLDEVDWLFWVGCAGAYEDRAKKTTRAVAELLDMAGVSFGVLGNGETCTGDSARRAGNEFLFQGLAQQNVETFKEHKVKKVVSTCAHCFNTLKNEYREFGIELEVVHHTQLLNRLVREGKLTPVKEGDGAHKRSITYHDPCYIGRHNGVYEPPRELLDVLPGATYVEMERNSERSFCCGAGGARMWMEETIGTRINNARTAEAVGTGADQIAVGCPFCRVMLDDGLTAAQAEGTAREEVEVLDVAQMLLASVKGQVATKRKPGEGGAAPAPAAKASPTEPGGGEPDDEETTVKEAADVGPAAKASSSDGGSSLFDTPAASETATADKDAAAEAEAAKPASTGGSLFDVGGDDRAEPAKQAAPDTEDDPEPEPEPEPAAQAESKPAASGGSLFDIKADETTPETTTETTTDTDTETDEPVEPEEKPEEKKAEPPVEPAGSDSSSALGSATSLFDIKAQSKPEPTTEPKAEAEPDPEAEPEPEPEAEPDEKQAPARQPAAAATDSSSEGGSLFDIAAPEVQATEPAPEPEPEAEAETEAEAEPEPEPESEPEPEAEPEPEVEAEKEKPKPASSGEAHQPKTDTDIGGASSLFDL